MVINSVMVTSLFIHGVFIHVELPRPVRCWIIEFIALVSLDMQNITSGNYWMVIKYFKTIHIPCRNICIDIDFIELKRKNEAGEVMLNQIHKGIVVSYNFSYASKYSNWGSSV